jgi:hypothetical protein
MIDWDP